MYSTMITSKLFLCRKAFSILFGCFPQEFFKNLGVVALIAKSHLDGDISDA